MITTFTTAPARLYRVGKRINFFHNATRCNRAAARAYISSMYQQPVGSASFNLSNNSNDIAIKFQAGWTMFYYGGGAYVPVYHPVFFPKTININQTIQIR